MKNVLINTKKYRLFFIGLFIGSLAFFIPKHQHKWVEIGKSYVPAPDNTCVGACGEELIFGQTVIRYRCIIDGEEKVKYFIGKVN